MASPHRSHALDHIVVVLFENRSLDNVLGHLYGPEDGKTFDGVIGKGLTNPIPAWAEHGADQKVVPYTVATDMDSRPGFGRGVLPHQHPALQHPRRRTTGARSATGRPRRGTCPHPGAPTMDGFVTDYISTFTGEIGRQPTYDEYAHIMTGYTPEQLPVLNGIARDFGVFDHWFCEVPSQTFMNRSFWTAATSSGIVVNRPVKKWFTKNDAETIFERMEAHGRTWKVYVMEPMPVSLTGVVHYPGSRTGWPRTSCLSPSSSGMPRRARFLTSRSSSPTCWPATVTTTRPWAARSSANGHRRGQPVVRALR